MSVYQKLAGVGERFISRAKLFRYGFNYSPMYRRSTGRIKTVSEDLCEVSIKIPLTWRNRNYVNSIFGGSMFSAVDPIPMVQLINILGNNYVVWDKSAEIKFKRPAKEHLFATFTYDKEELEGIKKQVAAEGQMELVKTTLLTNKDQSVVYCEVKKLLYIADKAFYKEKRKKRKAETA